MMFFWPGPRFFSDQQMNMILVREVLSLKFNQKVSKTIKNDFFVKKKHQGVAESASDRRISESYAARVLRSRLADSGADE